MKKLTKKRATKLTSVKKYSKTKRSLCVYDRFKIFTSFFGKYRGIKGMFLFKKDDKVILLIGERHENIEPEGFTRFSSVVNDVFESLDNDILQKTNSTLDFFFEIKYQHLDQYRKLRERLESKNSLNFDGREFDKDGKGFDLHMMRVYFSHYVPTFFEDKKLTKKNIRFHFADYIQPNSTIEDLSKMFSDYRQLFVTTLPNLTNPEEFNKMVDITKLLKGKTISLYYASLDDNITNRKLCIMATKLFFEDMKEAYTVTPDKFVRHGCDKFKNHFVNCMVESLNETSASNQRLFSVYRTYMDMYALCRMMRSEGNYYKNIVYYAGFNHILRLKCMIQRLGFTEVNIQGYNTYFGAD